MNRSLVVSLSFFLGACGAESALVGGECRPGFTVEANACIAARATVTPAPSSTSTATPGADVTSTTAATTPGATPATPEATLPGRETSGETANGVAVDPPVVVVNPEPVTKVCDAGFVACHGDCLAVAADGQNCGACGRICPSNICVAGVCQGATPGDIIVIGHDIAQAPSFSTHAKVFTNAVAIPTTDPLRVLAFESDASAGVSAKTRSLVAASNPSRGVRFGVVSSPEALEDSNLYASWDVVLVDGVAATNAASFGTSWGGALDAFTRQGGVLVALDDGTGDVPAFFAASSLLSLGARVSLDPAAQFVVNAPNDVVGAHLLSPYAAFGSTVGYDVAPQVDTTWVVRTAAAPGYPTVLHKIAR